MRLMSNVQFGTLGGTICSVWNSFDWSNLVQTVLVAIVGAAVSYLTSRLLEGRRRRRRRNW
jgi:membrane protein implicated in regulation of membrane protease activity